MNDWKAHAIEAELSREELAEEHRKVVGLAALMAKDVLKALDALKVPVHTERGMAVGIGEAKGALIRTENTAKRFVAMVEDS